MSLYRIAFVSGPRAHSVVRELAQVPSPGEQIKIDADTLVTARSVIAHPEGDTIAAEVLAELVEADALLEPSSATGSASRSSS